MHAQPHDLEKENQFKTLKIIKMTTIEMQLVAYIGQQAKTKIVEGKQVISFSACHTKRVKNKASGETKETPIWVNCDMWNESVKIPEILKKGTLILVKGEPSIRSYQDNRGITQFGLNLLVRDFTILLMPKEDQQQKDNAEKIAERIMEPQPTETFEDDLPF